MLGPSLRRLFHLMNQMAGRTLEPGSNSQYGINGSTLLKQIDQLNRGQTPGQIPGIQADSPNPQSPR